MADFPVETSLEDIRLLAMKAGLTIPEGQLPELALAYARLQMGIHLVNQLPLDGVEPAITFNLLEPYCPS